MKPTIAASEVPLISWTRKPMVAGSEMRKRLRQDDVLHPRDVVEAERLGGLGLALRHGLDGAAPDLAEEGAGMQR